MKDYFWGKRPLLVSPKSSPNINDLLCITLHYDFKYVFV